MSKSCAMFAGWTASTGAGGVGTVALRTKATILMATALRMPVAKPSGSDGKSAPETMPFVLAAKTSPTLVILMTAKTLIERLTAEAKLIREHVPNEDSAHHIVAGPAHADLLEASAQFAQTQADTIEVLLARVAELQDALKAAALRFELIANGCSEETANPRVGAQEARAILTKSKGELQP